MYFMVKKATKFQNLFRCENVITTSYHLIYMFLYLETYEDPPLIPPF